MGSLVFCSFVPSHSIHTNCIMFKALYLINEHLKRTKRTNEYTEHRTEIFEQCSLIMIIWIAEENCNRQTLAKAMYAQFGGGVGDGGGGGDGEDDCL